MPAAAVTGLVLAGGRGSRMGGVDKGLVPYRGEALAVQALHRLSTQAGPMLISANRNLEAYRALGAAFGAVVVRDADDGFAGPLAGLAAGLAACRTDWLASVPCDAPDFPLDLVRRLQEALLDAPMAVAATLVDGEPRLQPVFSLVRRDRLPALRHYLAGGGRRVGDWARQQGARTALFDDAAAFANLNSADDLLRPRVD